MPKTMYLIIFAANPGVRLFQFFVLHYKLLRLLGE